MQIQIGDFVRVLCRRRSVRVWQRLQVRVRSRIKAEMRGLEKRHLRKQDDQIPMPSQSHQKRPRSPDEVDI